MFYFQGQFIQTYQYNGQWYGLQMESIESVAREGLACVVHMELEVRLINLLSNTIVNIMNNSTYQF